MQQIETDVLAWGLSTLLGSGAALGIGWYALRGRLEEVFERKDSHERDLTAVRQHVNAEFLKVDRTMEGLDARVKDNATRSSRTETRVDVLTERVAGQGDNLGQVQAALSRLDSKMDTLAGGQATTSEAIKGLGHAVDQLREEVRRRA